MNKRKRTVLRGEETHVHYIPPAALNSRPQQGYVDRWRGSRRQVVRENFEFFVAPPPPPTSSTSSQVLDPFGNDEGLRLPDEDLAYNSASEAEDEMDGEVDEGRDNGGVQTEYSSLVRF